MTSVTPANGTRIRPVPGGWYGSEMGTDTESWQVAMPADVRADLLRVAAGLPPDRVAADPFQARPDVSARTRSLIALLHRRLTGDPGMVVLTGFPVAESPELVQAAYWALSLLLGRPVRQNLVGDLVTRIENVGRDASQPEAQGYKVADAQPFHVDRIADLVSLLCVRPASSGGLSRVVSCKQIHNVLLAENPDLLQVLYEPFPFSVHPFLGPDGPGEETWCGVPVFSRADGHFAAYYMRNLIRKTQDREDVPRLTPRQVAALDAVDEILSRPEMPLEMYLRPGDVELINNLHLLHSRTAFHDDTPRGQGRLLLRTLLAFPGSPALPAGYSALLGSTGAGVYRGGAWRTPEVRRRLGRPLAVV